MSMCYWAISGFGIENIEEWVSEEKLSLKCDGEEVNIVEYASSFYDSDGKSSFYFTDDGQGISYFLYSPSLPFNMTAQEKSFTCKDDIAIAMYEDLKDILDDNITVEDFKAKVDWVSTYGAG